MASKLDAVADDRDVTTDPDFTVLLEAKDGRRFTHAHGDSSAHTAYESASTSKWVTAAVILDLVDQGKLSLDTKASELIPFWTESKVDLRSLLSFTSGFSKAPFCLNRPRASFEDCVERIYDKNESSAAAPGAEYAYSSTHLQVAGLMAVKASGASSWSEVFTSFKARTGLFPTGAFDLPSEDNPRLAGGMTWTGEEYLAFLRALYNGELLQPDTRKAMFANQRGAAEVVASPARRLGEDWSYGLGNWLECPGATPPTAYNCGDEHRSSSAGAYGAYPFIDFDHGYFGIVARQGRITSGGEGVALVRTIDQQARAWAASDCTAARL